MVRYTDKHSSEVKQLWCECVEGAGQRQWVWWDNLSLLHVTKRSWVKLLFGEQKDQELGLHRGWARPGWECGQLGKSCMFKTRDSAGLHYKTVLKPCF